MISSIVILTGAGISAESGIQTFPRVGGLWEGHRVEDVATPKGFARDPELVQRSYHERRRGPRTIEANLEETAGSLSFDRCVGEKAGEVLPGLVDELLEMGS